MDLIDKITNVFKTNKTGLTSPIIELRYDNQQNIVGHITDDRFKSISDEDAQRLIWSILKKYLDSSELLKVIAIFHETPQERIERLSGHKSKELNYSNYWVHQTPELARYWLFIDIAKFGDEFKSIYLIICEKNNVNKGLTFVYNQEVLSFMELEPEEVYGELYTNTFGNAESEIKIDLMNRYEELTSKQLYGKANMYWYVYENFSLSSVAKTQLSFTEGEIVMIKKALGNIDDFKIKDEISKAVNKSEIINRMKHTVND